MTINLEKYVNQRVDIVLSNNEKYSNCVVQSLGFTTNIKPYINYKIYEITTRDCNTFYTSSDGMQRDRWNGVAGNFRIVQIELSKMNSKQQTLQKIKDLETQLEVLKKELEEKYPTPEQAQVGDVLEDGNIVFIKGDGYVIVSASLEFDVASKYDDCMEKYFGSDAWVQSKQEISGWFMPDEVLLRKAMLTIPETFKKGHLYWSSTKTLCVSRITMHLRSNKEILSEPSPESYFRIMRAFKVIAY